MYLTVRIFIDVISVLLTVSSLPFSPFVRTCQRIPSPNRDYYERFGERIKKGERFSRWPSIDHNLLPFFRKPVLGYQSYKPRDLGCHPPFFSSIFFSFFCLSFLLSLSLSHIHRHILFREIYRRPLNFCPSHQFLRLRIAEPGTIPPPSFAKRLQAWSFCRHTSLFPSYLPPSFAFKGSSPARVIFQPLPAPGDR